MRAKIKTAWKRGRLAVLGALMLALLAGPISAAPAPFPPELAIASVRGTCTGEMIAPRILMTASHCVATLGAVTQVRFGTGDTAVTLNGVVVWDSDWIADTVDQGLDLAFVRLPSVWPYRLEFEEAAIQVFPVEGESISMALGIHYWRAVLKIQGLFEVEDLGFVLAYRGDTFPGASGSVVLVGGKIVGIVTHGYMPAQPILLLGAPSVRLLWGLNDLRTKGEMYICNTPGQKQELCRRPAVGAE